VTFVKGKVLTFKPGDRVHIKPSVRTPYSNHFGILTNVTPEDPLGPFLVRFDDGVEFRYHSAELQNAPGVSGPRTQQ
jgi:hypothetical protein